MNRLRGLFAGVIAVIMVLMVGCGENVDVVKEEIYDGRYYYFVDNLKSNENDDARIVIWAALPVEHEGQHVTIREINPEPVEVITDSVNGNRVLIWEVKNPGDQLYTFYYDFQVTAEEVLNDFEDYRGGQYRNEERFITPVGPMSTNPNSPEYIGYYKESRRFTRSEPWIEITDDIRKKAKEITGKETDPYKKGKLIFDWVVENMEYEYPDINNRGSSKSFKRLKGDCGEFSHVFQALCRASGIPARSVICKWTTSGGHQWSEILIPGHGWIPVDTTVAKMLKPGQKIVDEENLPGFLERTGLTGKKPDFLYGNLYLGRIIIHTGNNFEIKSEKTSTTRTFRFMQPGGANAYPKGFLAEGFTEDPVHGGVMVFGEDRNDSQNIENKRKTTLALAYFQAKKFKKAEPGLKLILKENPESPQIHFQLGQLYINTGRFEKAIEHLKRSLELPGGSTKPVIDIWCHNLLGICYLNKGKTELAEKEFRLVLDSEVDYSGSKQFAEQNLKEIKKSGR